MAVICDVSQEILGMDFINKYRLNFEWDEFDQSELWLVDRKAQIKAPLQVVTVPITTPRISYLDPGEAEHTSKSDLIVSMSGQSAEAVAFQVACMEQLDKKVLNPQPETKKKKSIEEQLQMHQDEYAQLIRSYPELLNPSFKKGEPDHGVWHRIETGDHATPPARQRGVQ